VQTVERTIIWKRLLSMLKRPSSTLKLGKSAGYLHNIYSVVFFDQ